MNVTLTPSLISGPDLLASGAAQLKRQAKASDFTLAQDPWRDLNEALAKQLPAVALASQLPRGPLSKRRREVKALIVDLQKHHRSPSFDAALAMGAAAAIMGIQFAA